MNALHFPGSILSITRHLVGALSVAGFSLITLNVSAADFTGTNGNDAFFFQSTSEILNQTVTNPYSGESIAISGSYSVNNSTYNGLAGIDTLFMTNQADGLFIDDNGIQTVIDIEIYFAGNGSDLIHLASNVFTLGDTEILGGESDDIIWSNIGNDLLNGDDGNDIIDGGPGDDRLQGVAGNDTLHGGDGADFLEGGAQDDTLTYSVDGTITIDSVIYNLSHDVFDGGDGFDTINLTSGDDALFLDDPNSPFHPDAPAS